MTKLKSIDKLAVSAWSPVSQPLLALGTAAGAIDTSFSASAELEVFDLNLMRNGLSMKKVGSVSVASKFNRLSWSLPKEDASSRPTGVIAGGLEHGQVFLWDVQALVENKSEAQISKQSLHKGPVKGLDFNPIQPHLLATGATEGEILVWDLNNLTKPYSPGTKSQRLEDVTFLSWNRQASHILATASNNGNVIIWDLKSKRELTNLAYPGGRKPMTSVAWNPDEPLKIATAADDDFNPSILLWDLRNASSPFMQLTGHNQGILSITWCSKDSDLLLSCSKDNRTKVWNTKTGLMIGDLHVSENWGFEVKWCDKNPDLSVISSFDGKVSVHSIQGASAERDNNEESSSLQTSTEDLFVAAVMLGNQNIPKSIHPTFKLPQAPKWCRRPCSVAWGFGGRLAIVSSIKVPDSESRQSVVTVRTIETEVYLSKQLQELRQLLSYSSPEVLSEFCDGKARTDVKDKEIWNFLKVLLTPGTSQVSDFLGFQENASKSKITELFSKLKISNNKIGDESPIKSDLDVPLLDTQQQSNGLFDDGADTEFLSDQIKLGTNENIPPLSTGLSPPPKLTSPMKLLSSSALSKEEAEVDVAITKCVIIGDFESAVKLCLATDRLADALAFAIQGEPELLTRTQREYFTRTASKKSYTRLLQGVVYEEVANTVACADLEEADGSAWKYVMAYLYTYGSPDEIARSLSSLGRRLEEIVEKKSIVETSITRQKKDVQRAASLFCYLGASNIEKVVDIWTRRALSKEEFVNSSQYESYLKDLQTFIEKITVYSRAIGHEDEELYSQDLIQSYKLEKLYEKYTEYIKILADQGSVDIAWEYAKLIPEYYVSSKPYLEKLPAILRNKIYNSGRIVQDVNYAPGMPFEYIDVVDQIYFQQNQEQKLYDNRNQTQAKSNAYAPIGKYAQNSYQSNSTSNPYYQNPQAPQAFAGASVATWSTPSNVPPPQSNYMTPSPVVTRKGGSFTATSFSNLPPQPYSDQVQETVNSYGQVPSAQVNNPYSQSQGVPFNTNPYGATIQGQQQNGYGISPAPDMRAHGVSPVSLAPPPMGQPQYVAQYPSAVPVSHPIVPPPISNQYAQQYTTSVGGQGVVNGASYQSASNSQYSSAMNTPALNQRKIETSTADPTPRSGDRSRIVPAQKILIESIDRSIKQLGSSSSIGAQQRKMLDEAEKKFVHLSDQMNSGQLKPEVVDMLSQVIKALDSNNYTVARKLHLELITTHYTNTGQWIVGLKQLIDVTEKSKNPPPVMSNGVASNLAQQNIRPPGAQNVGSGPPVGLGPRTSAPPPSVYMPPLTQNVPQAYSQSQNGGPMSYNSQAPPRSTQPMMGQAQPMGQAPPMGSAPPMNSAPAMGQAPMSNFNSQGAMPIQGQHGAPVNFSNQPPPPNAFYKPQQIQQNSMTPSPAALNSQPPPPTNYPGGHFGHR